MDEAIHARLGAAAATLMPLVEAMRVFAAASGDTARLHVFTISASHDGGAGKVGLARRRKIKAMQGAARRVRIDEADGAGLRVCGVARQRKKDGSSESGPYRCAA